MTTKNACAGRDQRLPSNQVHVRCPIRREHWHNPTDHRWRDTRLQQWPAQQEIRRIQLSQPSRGTVNTVCRKNRGNCKSARFKLEPSKELSRCSRCCHVNRMDAGDIVQVQPCTKITLGKSPNSPFFTSMKDASFLVPRGFSGWRANRHLVETRLSYTAVSYFDFLNLTLLSICRLTSADDTTPATYSQLSVKQKQIFGLFALSIYRAVSPAVIP